MADILDDMGLDLATFTELRDDLTESLKNIYGDDISVESDDPDGQVVNIYSQKGADLRQKIQQVFASYDIDQATGRNLDARVGMLGIKRRGATYTKTDIKITTDKPLLLTSGFKCQTAVREVFQTVKDFSLLSGENSIEVQAEKIGKVDLTPNTITEIITVTAGVLSVINSTAPSIGVNEESDEELKIRKTLTLSSRSKGFLESTVSLLFENRNITDVQAVENDENSASGEGVPPHSIWIIAEGGGDTEIADAIYRTRAAGIGTKGSESVTISKPNIEPVVIKFDRPEEINLYVKMKVQDKKGINFNIINLKNSLVKNLTYKMNESSASDDFAIEINTISETLRATEIRVSKDGISYSEIVTPDFRNKKFVLATDRITINDQ